MRVQVPPPAPIPYTHLMLRRLLARLSPANPLIEVGISKSALLHNLHTYQQAYPGLAIAPVLKSNAYGHDMGLVARTLDGENIAFFMVDSLYEARRLRATGIRSRILVMGYVRPEDIASSTLGSVDFAITDIDQLRVLSESVTSAVRIHLKLDTGMHRQGILPKDLQTAIQYISNEPLLRLVGVCSHFADADEDTSPHNEAQLAIWTSAQALVEESFSTIEYKHFSATKGARFAKEAGTNVLRLGIGLYGFDTSPTSTSTLLPVLELRSIIGELRTVPASEFVGYNATYSTTKETVVATIPAGYYEGVDRRLSSRGFVRVSGIVCPIIGRVSMNMVSVDVTDVPDVRAGDKVMLVERSPDSPLSMSSIASAVSTTEYTESIYVLLAHIPQHLKRVLE